MQPEEDTDCGGALEKEIDEIADALAGDILGENDMEAVLAFLRSQQGRELLEEQQIAPLKYATLEEVAEKIKGGARVVTMAGAGLSVSAGIPDFRTPGTGLYDNLEKFKLPYPEAIFELRYFRNDPEPFYLLAQEMFPGKWQPTPGHYFVKLLEEKGVLLRAFTQNIDTLERVAGISSEVVVEAHGSFSDASCIDCFAPFEMSEIERLLFSEKTESAIQVPRCCACGGLVKPNITFFGENLPEKFFKNLHFLPQADVLLVLGTSLAVMPFASLVGRVKPDCLRVLINREPVGPFRDREERDVLMLGDCDDQCQKLVDLLGWGEDYERIKMEGRARVAATLKK